MEPILIPLIVFATIFGIFYLFISARNRERLALIEKGTDASIFYGEARDGTKIRRIITLNVALSLMGVGFGIGIAILLYAATQEEAVYPACITFFAGAGLLTSFFVNRNMK